MDNHKGHNHKGHENLLRGENFLRGNKRVLILVGILFCLLFVSCVSANNYFNYVYNETAWVPMLSTSSGQQKMWIEMKNCSYGYVVENLTVDTNVLHVDSNNNRVGIGTLTPLQELNVEGDGNITGSLYVLGQNISSTFGSYVPYIGATSNLVLGANNFSVDSSVLFVDSTNNNVGIGTTAPTAELHISNTGANSNPAIKIGNDVVTWNMQTVGARSDNFEIWNPTLGTALAINPTTGNVGIGTTSPLSKLAINGGLHVGGDSDAGDNNLLVDGTGSFTGAVTASSFTKAGDCTDADAVGTSCGGGKKYATGLVSATSDGGSYNWWDATTYCRDIKNGYNDWYIPTKSELNTLYGQKTTVGGFVSGYYWTSSEYPAPLAWYQSFGNGYQDYHAKTCTGSVRCIRRY